MANRFTRFLLFAALAPTALAQMSLTPQASQAGFKLTVFADSFPTEVGIGPIGIAFPDGGGVLVSDYTGGIRRLPTRQDGQHANSISKASDFGVRSGGGMAKSGGHIYAADQNLGRLLLLNDDGTLNQVVVGSGFIHDAGLAANPSNGHIFLSIRDAGVPDRIVDFDPVSKTSVTFKNNVSADGISFSPDGKFLYAALLDTTHILGYRVADGLQVFDSDAIAGADGCVVGSGKLTGFLFVNTNDGRVVQIDLMVSTQTVLASGGSRGDLVAVDPFDGSLLLTQTDKILRLSPPAGSGFAVPAPAVSGVANGADFSTTVAPGSLASLFGSSLAPGIAAPAALPIPTTLNGVTVSVNGTLAPITYVSSTQINFQVPVATAAGTASLTVNSGGQTSSAVQFTVAASAPGIFQYGANRGIVVNQDQGLNASDKPAASGSTVVAYLTGIGLTNPAVANGSGSPGGPLAVPPGPFSASIGGTIAPVAFLGLTPGFVGLAQANIQVPSLASGDYPLIITVNGKGSRPALVSVTGSGTIGGNGGSGIPPGLPSGAKCVSGTVDYITFSLESKASGQADEVSIGGNRLCAKCDLKPPIYGNFADKMEGARIDGLSVDACYDGFGTLTYLRMR